MKHYVAFIIAIFLASIGCSKQAAQAESAQRIPGTPINLVLPNTYKPTPLGTSVVSNDRTATITLVIGPIENDPMKSEGYRGLFPNPPESVRTENFDASLYKRTRAKDGGA